MDQSTAFRIAEQYTEKVKKVFQPESIVLFGSYARGDFREGSDIDVAIVFQEFDGDYLDTMIRLGKLRDGISYEIEPHVLVKNDDRSGFAKHVMKTGHILYQAAA